MHGKAVPVADSGSGDTRMKPGELNRKAASRKRDFRDGRHTARIAQRGSAQHQSEIGFIPGFLGFLIKLAGTSSYSGIAHVDRTYERSLI